MERKLKDRVGEVHKTANYGTLKIIEYYGSGNCTVQFEDGTIVKQRKYAEIAVGKVRNPNMPNVCGLGFEGQGEYSAKDGGKDDRASRIWRAMFSRCHNERQHFYSANYVNVSVCEEWYNFQNFAKWFYENYNPNTTEIFRLDKDILCPTCKVYSPDTCIFVPNEINVVFAERKKKTEYKGVRKEGKRFKAQINIHGKRTHLGTFDTAEEAFQAYKIAKESYIKNLADKWKDQLSPKAYEAMYNYELKND